MKFRLLYILLFLSTASSATEDSTTKQLFSACKTEGKDNKYSDFCLGQLVGYKHSIDELITVYARGYADGAAHAGHDKKSYLNGQTIDLSYKVIINTYGCVRDQTTDDLATAFIQWIDNNPKEMDKSLLFTARQAFVEHFPPPCKVWE